MDLVLIRPEDLGRGAAYRFSDQIVNGLRKERELAVVGFGNAISLACMAVQISSGIANVSIGELSLDYIGAPSLAISGVFFVLDKESRVNWEEEKKKIDDKMKLDFSRDGQLVVVSRRLSPEKMVPLCLAKIARSGLLKIAARGISINRAVSLALEIARGNIAKEPVGITLVTLSTVTLRREDTEAFATAMEIYLHKGVQTVYTAKHKEVLEKLE